MFSEIKLWWDLAMTLHSQGRYDDALDCLCAVERRRPNFPGLHAAFGTVCRDSGDLKRAEHYLRRACAAQPDDPAAHFNLALTLLRAGQWQEGFREYEWRWRVPQFREQRREFKQPVWLGEPYGDPLHGRRILIYGEQGAGDAIQFVRYAPLVRSAGGEVTIEVLPHLERLLSWMDGEYRIVNTLTAGVEFDVQCPLMSLPHRFGTGLDSIPPPAIFTIPSSDKVRWANRLRTSLKNIGVVWATNPAYFNNADRSIPGHYLRLLTDLPRVQCWGLQVGPAAKGAPDGIVNLSDELFDFAETAAAISQLDLIVTVDTAVAHLAGSLGRPTWLMLAYNADWRWLLDREDTPWYPGMRIIRQKRPGEWTDVIDRVASDLSLL